MFILKFYVKIIPVTNVKCNVIHKSGSDGPQKTKPLFSEINMLFTLWPAERVGVLNFC